MFWDFFGVSFKGYYKISCVVWQLTLQVHNELEIPQEFQK